ncbi:hypothetical protein BAY61_12085 [Prauserella marina]|uniref:Uncharacterized protein n=1 Tax=Prauserella marina TaxID=530584 RepID=A0A222VPD1_9PSEU|nr:hypothetical protein [Prauserella marina]ASR35613.1 hypothetical protein BAY61_12085 [Prauserella marina]PWV84524.1 hypothetical protein DES30_101541 [Prauserella marina]SDC20168.1 hypothetical protein SAMN05421630_101795 [Prauserella marina]
MTEHVRELTTADLGWAVETLRRYRDLLVPGAPLLWRPAADADEQHHAFLTRVIGEDGGRGFRTAHALLIASASPRGWIVDDAAVPAGEWPTTGRALWSALAATAAGDAVRFVCPVPDTERRRFADGLGLTLATSWWHKEIPGGTEHDEHTPHVDGATARLVPAPPIYAPGGPVLFLTSVTEPATALASADTAECGAALVVVDQPFADTSSSMVLTEAGFRRHCDFLEGRITQP